MTRRLARLCPECGTAFEPVKKRGGWTRCCEDCGPSKRAVPTWWAGHLGVSCQVCDKTNGEARRAGGRLTLHHVVYRQHVRAEGGDEWSTENGLTVCDGTPESCHRLHHSRQRPIALAAIPDAAYAFAEDLLGATGAHAYLARYYDGNDPRHAALGGF